MAVADSPNKVGKVKPIDTDFMFDDLENVVEVQASGRRFTVSKKVSLSCPACKIHGDSNDPNETDISTKKILETIAGHGPGHGTLGNIPAELQSHIFSYLVMPDQVCLALTCKVFSRIATTTDLNDHRTFWASKTTKREVKRGDIVRCSSCVVGLSDRSLDWSPEKGYFGGWSAKNNKQYRVGNIRLGDDLGVQLQTWVPHTLRLCRYCERFRPMSKDYWWSRGYRYHWICKWVKYDCTYCPRHTFKRDSKSRDSEPWILLRLQQSRH